MYTYQVSYVNQKPKLLWQKQESLKLDQTCHKNENDINEDYSRHIRHANVELEEMQEI